MEEPPVEEAVEIVDAAGPEPLSESESKVLEYLAEALHWFEVGLAALSVIFVALGVL